jgi:hypothetical protein
MMPLSLFGRKMFAVESQEAENWRENAVRVLEEGSN